MNFVVAIFSDLFVYMLSIGLQAQNRNICQSSFYVEREIRDKQSKSKSVAINFMIIDMVFVLGLHKTGLFLFANE